MEVGYDYLLLRSRLQQRFVRASGFFLVITGTVLLGAAIAYYIYAHQARSGLDRLNYSISQQGPLSVETDANAAALASRFQLEPSASSSLPPTSLDSAVAPGASNLATTLEPVPEAPPVLVSRLDSVGVALPLPPAADTAPLVSPSAIEAQQLFPGNAIKAAYWSDPLRYEPDSYIVSTLIKSFRPIGPNDVAAVGTLPAPTRIILPSVGVDSEVTGLRVLDLGDSRAYETPKHVVGYIPEAASPGENGSAWFFGHLESPIAGEGNVFYNLPKIPDQLRDGQDVYAVVENETASYLYRITETRVVHQDDMKLYDTGGPTIHLVSCVPRFVYDHRLIVTGELVGVKR